MHLRRTSFHLGLLLSVIAALACARPSLAAFGPGSAFRQAVHSVASLTERQMAPSSGLDVSGPQPAFALAQKRQSEAPLALAGKVEAMEQEAPSMIQVRVHKSNLRRMQWGYALTIAGIFGILVGGVGMVVASRTAGKDKGPAALANPSRARRYRAEHRAGMIMLFSGLGVGISGMIAGPLLIRSARRRQQALWMDQASRFRLFPGLQAKMP